MVACQKDLNLGSTTAAALVNSLIVASDDRCLQRLQKLLLSRGLLILDELGFVPLSKTAAELLFEIISQSYKHGTIVNRLIYHAHIFELNVDRFRSRDSRKAQT
ncbi:ATP-binding protein [Sulfitobacter sp. F26169L]|uniref:ATP-binding protein n=1 Tax=Sulfitobacter sp. F26169L TaxID=2996015 RepID=UPI0022608822|nr:ATP-binding protein [Sulfitobacter sp. F26169L]MCX7568166.1 ATP-binding protein [Sulfitobacter sp. F26169L]